jgi:hypothetical protein
MRFVTRSKVHVDRMATAWAIRFDMRGAELGHHAGRCTFEVLLESYELRDPALRRMGDIVRAIDVPFDSDVTEEVAALTAAFNELRDAEIADEERLRRGYLVCEELYVMCGGSREEVQR